MTDGDTFTFELIDALFDSPACGYCLVNAAGRVLRANDEWLRSTGLVRDRVLGQCIVSLFPGTEALSTALHALARTGRRVHVPKHAQLLAGRESWWDGWISPVALEDGTGLLICARELEAATPVAGDPKATQAIVEATDDVVYAKDVAGRMVYANAATLALIGKPLTEVLGRTDAEFLADASAAEAVMQNDREVMASAHPVDIEERVPLPDGTERMWLSRKVAWRDSHGRLIGLLGISRNITERYQAQQTLRQAQLLMQSTLDNFPTAITFKDREGRFIEVNRAVQQMFGRPREALLGLAPHDFLPPEQADRVREDEHTVMRTAKPLQSVHERSLQGRHYVFVDTMFPLTDDQGAVYGVGYISHDVTAQKQAERELNAANAQLLQSAQHKDHFIATLAHELRNPLAPIRTAAELIRARASDDATIVRAQQIISRQSEHLTRIVDDLLDVSRVTFGTLQLHPEILDLAGVAVACVEAAQAEFERVGIHLQVQVSSVVKVRADATRLTQCVANLLNNALKFTLRGGTVQMRVRREADHALLEVQDSGVGIEPASLERIFELFVQDHRSGQHGNKGLGIGLALTRRLIALHGGTVTAHSQGRGTGSLFTIRLPVAQLQLDEPAPTTAPAVHNPTGLRVLVVDDNADAADTISELLRLSGHSSQTAYSGEDALNLAQGQPLDAVVLDIGLPGIDGYEVCRRLRAQGGRQQLVLALTGWGQESDRAKASDAGFDEHLTKPADVERLIALIEQRAAQRAVP